MSLEHDAIQNTPPVSNGTGRGKPRAPISEHDYWNALIDEKAAADFLGLSERTMQSYRQRGCGPPYLALSSRCLRYTRIKCKGWAEDKIRTSTSDPGPQVAA